MRFIGWTIVRLLGRYSERRREGKELRKVRMIARLTARNTEGATRSARALTSSRPASHEAGAFFSVASG